MTIKIRSPKRRIVDQGIRTATLAAETVEDHATDATGDARELPMVHDGDHAVEIAIGTETVPANTDVTDHETTEARDAAAATTTMETTSRLQSAAR